MTASFCLFSPKSFTQVLKFNLTESGLLCVLPWLTMAVFANVGGWIADTLVQRGVSITNVRKVSSPSVIFVSCVNSRAIMLKSYTDLKILLKHADADYAIDWFSWASLVLVTAEQSPDSSNGRIMYGLQSG